VNVETKEQAKQWMHTHLPNKPKSINKCLPFRKLMATVFWDRTGQERSADGGIRATRDDSNVRSILQNNKKIA
jgi:hypothetical protein